MHLKIISSYNERYKSISDLSFSTVLSFCEKHNFKCERFLINQFSRPPAWFKIFQLIKEIESSTEDYFVWIDADAIIYNMDFDLKFLLSDNQDLYIAKDLNNFNTGVFIIKNCDFNLNLLKKMYSMIQYDNHIWWEQAAFIDLFESNYENIQSRVKIVDQSILNAYDYRYYGLDEFYNGHYNKNSFTVHFPSLPLETRLKLMKKLTQ